MPNDAVRGTAARLRFGGAQLKGSLLLFVGSLGYLLYWFFFTQMLR